MTGRGGSKTRPYLVWCRRFKTRPCNDDNAMDMVWHDDKSVQADIEVMIG